MAILLSFVVVLVYLAFRFEWRFGVAAVIATAHDILASLAFIGLTRLEVSLFVVAGAAHDRRLLAERHHRHLRPDPGEPAPLQAGPVRRSPQPLDQRDAAADRVHRHHRARQPRGARGAGRRGGAPVRAADAVRRGGRHLLVDLHRRRRRCSRSSSGGPGPLCGGHGTQAGRAPGGSRSRQVGQPARRQARGGNEGRVVPGSATLSC